MEHSEKCKASMAALQAAIDAYQTQWPNFCHTCGGWGAFQTVDSVPYGPGSVSMYGSEPCGACIDEGKCPRCGAQALDEDGENCASCGWNWEKTPGCPEGPDGPCECEEAEIDRLADAWEKSPVYAEWPFEPEAEDCE